MILSNSNFVQKNINFVVDNMLCSACGACAAICPRDAIVMTENKSGFLLAKTDASRCTNCGLCIRTCPSYQENQTLESRENFYGLSLEAYVGHATSENVRADAQSGGVVTALLQFLLKTGEIEGAFVNRFNAKSRKPEVFYAKTEAELHKAAGSFYSQTAVAGAVLKKQIENSAAVVLGCQAEAIHLANNTNSKFIRPKYLIGLLCGGQNSSLNAEYLIDSCKKIKDKSKVIDFRYRSKHFGGWPGNVRIVTENSSYQASKDLRLLSKDLFRCYRCQLCFDKSNVYSDIVCGDPWGLSRYSPKEGNTIVLVRTQKGRELIQKAVEAGVIRVEHLKPEDIFESAKIRDVVVERLAKVYAYAKEQSWTLPYSVSDELVAEQGSLEQVSRDMLNFARKMYTTENPQILITQKNKEIHTKLRKMKMKNLIRKLRYYSKRLLRM